MTDREVKLVLGGLLHDIGKVIYRQGDDRRKHSQSGYDFLKNEIQTEVLDSDVLGCVRYHHADAIRGAELSEDALAYIVYIADNIASAADRRGNDSADVGFDISLSLQSVFNILNGTREVKYYEPKTLDPKDGINYPVAEKKKFDEAFYTKVKANLTDNLSGLEWTQEYINSLLEVLEANLSYVPSSTAKSELADISLYDHVKLTAAISSCILEYLEEQGIVDYREKLFAKGTDFYAENAFLLYSMDMSGIQDFIYTIASKNALKTLRTRSFYLEIMMEHIIDSLLQKLHLSRANLIYSGGGHCYILMANTEKTRFAVESYMRELNSWLLETFQVSLYAGWGYAVCSANALKNFPEGSYEEIFRTIGEKISARKSHRYTPDQIRMLNTKKYGDYTRECKACKKITSVDEEGICPLCNAIRKFSRNILYDEYFTVMSDRSEDALPLPGECYLTSDDDGSLKIKMQQGDHFVRAYSKNKMVTGKHIATKLWVGNYTDGKTFEEYAQESEGIRRLGIIRADVDNLGHAFVSGFADPENQNRYVTLSRTAVLSRQLSLFFKWHINRILESGEYTIDGRKAHSRMATICYSGGDDLFIVGAWNDIIELAVDIQKGFERYTQGALTLSAGIGIYEAGYPIRAAADEVAGMEECSKSLPGKNAVTLLEDGGAHNMATESGGVLKVSDGTYSWHEFEESVLREKYQHIYRFFENSQDRGGSFLYHLLELIRDRGDKINFARYVYILSRLEPGKEAEKEQRDAYREFSSKMYQWYQGEGSDADCRHLKTAMTLYAYLTREKEEMADEGE